MEFKDQLNFVTIIDKFMSLKATLSKQRTIQNQNQKKTETMHVMQTNPKKICKKDNMPATVPVMTTTPEAFFTTENERR